MNSNDMFVIQNCCERMAEATKLGDIEISINTLEEIIEIVVAGCCGGCNIINEVRFCPFCGTELYIKVVDKYE